MKRKCQVCGQENGSCTTATTSVLLTLSPSALHALLSAAMIKQRLHGGHIKTASW